MVDKRETIYLIISISEERLSSFFISIFFLIYPFSFTYILFCRICAHSSLPTYLGGTFSLLLDISERNFFSRWGEGEGTKCQRDTCFMFYFVAKLNTQNSSGSHILCFMLYDFTGQPFLK